MGFTDEIVQVDVLERHLLAGLSPDDYKGTYEDDILYDASFGATEDKFIKYQITRWILLSIVLILAWGVGLLMLLYLPIWIYVCRRDFRSRKLIENIGVRRPASDDIKIAGVIHPHDFRKAVLVHLLNTRNMKLSQKAYVHDDHQSTSSNPVATSSVAPLGDLLLEKLDEVEISVKKMQALVEGVETSRIKA
uniref:DUF7642 domain-containing protein n=1 Tax=Leersia perrieri TaxID=77586 RepID=A0A0D9Y0N7_9ORYZ